MSYIYIAGPLYTPGDRHFLELIDNICKKHGFKTYLPHRDTGIAPSNGSITYPYYKADISKLNEAEIVVAILNGTDVDSGTAWEMGYAYSKNKLIIGIYDDTRVVSPKASFNLMITSTTKIVNSLNELKSILENIKIKEINKNMNANDKDIELVYDEIKNISLEIDENTIKYFGYDNLPLCLIDAILSINRNYKNFVLPRVEQFKKEYNYITKLNQLLDLIQSMTKSEFAKNILKYNDIRRVYLLIELIQKLQKIINETGKNEKEILAVRKWMIKNGVYGYKNLNVKGIGIATYQYLRMLLGIDTVKPDVHIKRFLEKILNRKLKEEYCIKLLESIAKKMNIPSISLDHAIWKKSSSKNLYTS